MPKKPVKEVPSKSSVLAKLRENSTVADSSVLSTSKLFDQADLTPTSVPMVNVALSGRLDGGITPGLTIFAGPSKHFKTAFMMLLARAYMDKYPDAALLFYDSEFGAPQEYFESFGIDLDRVWHTPITDIEMLKHDIMVQLQNIERNDRVLVMVDSIGNLASKKEIDDALDGKVVADMTRAKAFKSLFRMVTPHLNLKNISMVVAGHTYKEMSMFPKDILGGGTGAYYAAQNIFIIGRRQEKDADKDVNGFTFVINVEKSRYVKEKSQIPTQVFFETGINRWSGLLDVGLESGWVEKPAKGKYARRGESETRTEEETNTPAFWKPILADPQFQDWVKNRYSVANESIMKNFGGDDD